VYPPFPHEFEKKEVAKLASWKRLKIKGTSKVEVSSRIGIVAQGRMRLEKWRPVASVTRYTQNKIAYINSFVMLVSRYHWNGAGRC
jgi:hypothetical protein